jgi:hypothetical protein
MRVRSSKRRRTADRASNGNPLLLTAGHLRWEVIHPVAETDQCKSLFGRHRLTGYFGNQRNVLASGETRDEIIELEDEPDGVAPVLRERLLVCPGEFCSA